MKRSSDIRFPSGIDHDSPGIIFVSGWGHGTEAMAPIASAFAESCRVHSMSLPQLISQAATMKKDNSERADGDDGQVLSSYARALKSLINEEIGPVCLIGWSTGAMAAIETAAARPKRVSALVLLSATARFCSMDDYAPGIPPASLRAMRRGMKKDPHSVLDAFFTQASHPLSISEEERARKVDSALSQGTDLLNDGLDYLQNTDLRSSLGSIALPCLVIHGKQDRIIPWGAAEFLSRNLPRAALELLTDAGHCLPEQCRQAITQRIADFLGDVL